MECGGAATALRANPSAVTTPATANSAGTGERSPARTGLHVNFTDKGEVKERREKFLTAKYGAHQMALIRKRLAVEMWLYDELQKLYDIPKDGDGGGGGGSGGLSEVDVDIDELLDMDTDELRHRHLAFLLPKGRILKKSL